MTDFNANWCVQLVGQLTPRQVEVLEALASGAPRKQMAEKLGMSEHTLRTHCQMIYERLGIHSEVEAVRVAVAGKVVKV